MKNLTVTMTDGQANALLQIIDLAVKAGGMAVARAGVELDDLIRNAANEPQILKQENE